MKILVLNSGSSSQKLCLYDLGESLPGDPPACLWEAKIEWDGEQAAFVAKTSAGASQQGQLETMSRPKAVEHLLGSVWSGQQRVLSSPSEIDVVGHRVVHGGPDYEEPALITAEVKAGIAKASAFAPLHNRAELDGMEIVEKLLGSVPQIAVFDTGFHRKMPLSAAIYPGPYEWFSQGIRRYGFHGINHQYCAGRAAQLLRRKPESLKLVTCHLGNGCSLAAIQDGHSIDTTMGFTPLEGLMMGTRSGSVDPGIITYLMRRDQIDGPKMDDTLNHKSGLLGISGVSEDMRQILAAIKENNPRAKLAFDIYIHRLQAGIGAMVAALGGVDALVFTAGVGENSPEVRQATCSNLEFLGLKLDAAKNAKLTLDADIGGPDSRVRILVIRAQEDWAIARECWKLARETTNYSD
ncbi:MAG TPA: acetate kinase [Candidatus Sulfotelmatobacter sp.]|jgi:acetate kinase